MNIVSLGSERIAISFKDIEVNINNEYYNNITFIIRLLTYDELVRVTSLDTENSIINLIIEEDIFATSLISISGINTEMGIDIEGMEAGVISTIASAIINTSRFYLADIEASIEKEKRESTVFNQMQLVVAKNFNIQFKDVIKMPIDELVRKFALFQETFPNESLVFNKEEK